MKILYITTTGKTMGFFKSYIHVLLDEAHTVDIAANETNSEVPSCYREWGCRVHLLPCSRSPLDKRNLKAIHEIRSIVQNGDYDLVHCHTPIAAACTRIACRPLRKKGVKVFYTAHGFHFYKGAPLKNWLLYFPVEWLCAFWTDVLITINKEDYARAKKHLHAKRVEYVPGVGIDVKHFADAKIDRVQKRRELDIPEDTVLLLSVGELNKNKNHEAVIRSLAKMQADNIHYMIVGRGSLEDFLKNLSETLGIKERVRFLGYRNDVAELYKAADIFAFPSIREGLPVSVIEAMAAGLPVVAAKIRGVTDLLEGSDNPLLDSCNDVDAFVREISRLCEDKNLRGSIGKANQLLSEEYGAERIIQIMKSIYISSEK